MLYTDIDSLLNISVSDSLVDDDADCGFGDVVDNSGFTVVHFVWHALRFLSVQVLIFADERSKDYPFWTAPFALMSTISPTLC